MPITTTAEPGRRFAILSVTDPYDIEEWRAGMLETFVNPVFRAQSAILIDRRLATAPSVEFVEAMTTFFSGHQQHLRNGRGAVVVGDDASFGMARMAELKSRMDLPHATIHVFREYDVAVRWLLEEGSRPRHYARAETDPARALPSPL